MTTKQMDCALELSHTLNFSRAAENLFISQPSLTYQIQCMENEIGFQLFERSGKGADLTPAGARFCTELRRIRTELKAAVEQGQNMSSQYSEALNVCIPMRSCVYFLPQIMQRFEATKPHVALNIKFVYGDNRVDFFLRGEQDILFARESELKRFSNIRTASLFDSRFYIVVCRDDPLAAKEILCVDDLAGQTFMVGGGSPSELVTVQNRIVGSGQVRVLNCPDHETAMANVIEQVIQHGLRRVKLLRSRRSRLVNNDPDVADFLGVDYIKIVLPINIILKGFEDIVQLFAYFFRINHKLYDLS